MSVVWFGHVTVGFTGRMPLASAPRAASRRSVGTGRYGSSSAQLGNPSRLMRTMCRDGRVSAEASGAGTGALKRWRAIPPGGQLNTS